MCDYFKIIIISKLFPIVSLIVLKALVAPESFQASLISLLRMHNFLERFYLFIFRERGTE